MLDIRGGDQVKETKIMMFVSLTIQLFLNEVIHDMKTTLESLKKYKEKNIDLP